MLQQQQHSNSYHTLLVLQWIIQINRFIPPSHSVYLLETVKPIKRDPFYFESVRRHTSFKTKICITLNCYSALKIERNQHET